MYIKSLNLGNDNISRPIRRDTTRAANDVTQVRTYGNFLFIETGFTTELILENGQTVTIVEVDLLDYTLNDYTTITAITIPLIFSMTGPTNGSDLTFYIVQSADFLAKFINLQTINISYNALTMDGIIPTENGDKSIYEYTDLVIANNIVYKTYIKNVSQKFIKINFIPPKATTINLPDTITILGESYGWSYNAYTDWCGMLDTLPDFTSTSVEKKNGVIYVKNVEQAGNKTLFRILPSIGLTFNIESATILYDPYFTDLIEYTKTKLKITVSQGNLAFVVINNDLYFNDTLTGRKSLILVSPITSNLVIASDVDIQGDNWYSLANSVKKITSDNTAYFVQNNCLYSSIDNKLLFIPINNSFIILQTPIIDSSNYTNLQQEGYFLYQKILIKGNVPINLLFDITITRNILYIEELNNMLVTLIILYRAKIQLFVIIDKFIYKLNLKFIGINSSTSPFQFENNNNNKKNILRNFYIAMQNINSDKISSKIWTKGKTTIIIPSLEPEAALYPAPASKLVTASKSGPASYPVPAKKPAPAKKSGPASYPAPAKKSGPAKKYSNIRNLKFN